MTCIAWDGKSIAVDRQVTSGDLRMSSTKVRRLATGEIVTKTGNIALGLMIERWYEGGCVDDFPEAVDDESATFIVLGPTGVKYYQGRPVAILIEDEIAAFGSGREFALGAMAMGADARQAVEVANRFCTSCGIGVDVMRLEQA